MNFKKGDWVKVDNYFCNYRCGNGKDKHNTYLKREEIYTVKQTPPVKKLINEIILRQHKLIWHEKYYIELEEFPGITFFIHGFEKVDPFITALKKSIKNRV